MRRRGFALSELLAGMMVMTFVLGASVSLLLNGLQSFAKTTMDAELATDNALGVRRMAESLRGAFSVSISGDGTTITYSLPARSNGVDVLTGERELLDPPQSDGVVRTFQANLANGTVTDGADGKVIVRHLAATDPQQGSSQYGIAYTPFQLTTIGSIRAVSINLITQDHVLGQPRYVRHKTTAVIRNTQ